MTDGGAGAAAVPAAVENPRQHPPKRCAVRPYAGGWGVWAREGGAP